VRIARKFKDICPNSYNIDNRTRQTFKTLNAS